MSVNTGAVILTGENRSNRRKTCPNATLSTINGTVLAWYRTRACAARAKLPTNHLRHARPEITVELATIPAV